MSLVLTFTLPQIHPEMRSAVIQAIYVHEDALITRAGKFLDVSVDLSSVALHDCPAISFFRIALRDRAYVRSLLIARGDEVAVGTPMARLSTEPDEPLDGVPNRPARVTIAGILYQPDWWQ
ncbi:MAG: hypothetical protein JO349_04490 [Candidatus Eremiobacteraeota bacterium]|nr:hypothetical protein [Candidatus Eremiobacteraeota bacterium]